jgi:hypothetical protein
MTSQTKHYIDLTDVLGTLLACKACPASVTLPIDSQSLPRVCPNCGSQWVDPYSARKPDQIFAEFIRAFKTLQRSKYGDNPAPTGFDLTLEIKSDPKGNL